MSYECYRAFIRHSLFIGLIVFAVINILLREQRNVIENTIEFYNTFLGLVTTVYIAAIFHIYLYGFVTRVVFTEVRQYESQAVVEVLVSLFLFKTTFASSMFGYSIRKLTAWLLLFSLFGSLRLYSIMALRRCQYSSLGGTGVKTERSVYVRIIILLLINLAIGYALGATVFLKLGHLRHVPMVITYELLILTDLALNPLIHAILHWNLGDDNWSGEIDFNHYMEVIFNIFIFCCTISYDFYIILTLGIRFRPYIFITMLSFVSISLLGASIVRKHRKFIATKNYLKNILSPLTYEDLANVDDICVICREKLDPNKASQTRKLPCGHIFHYNCLRSWLPEQNACPYFCENNLMGDFGSSNTDTGSETSSEADEGTERAHIQGAAANTLEELLRSPATFLIWLIQFFSSLAEFFRGFDSTHRQNLVAPRQEDVDRVMEIFPNLGREDIIQNLRESGNVNVTIENAMNGRISSTGNGERDAAVLVETRLPPQIGIFRPTATPVPARTSTPHASNTLPSSVRKRRRGSEDDLLKRAVDDSLDDVLNSYEAPKEFGSTPEERRNQFLERKKLLRAQVMKKRG